MEDDGDSFGGILGELLVEPPPRSVRRDLQILERRAHGEVGCEATVVEQVSSALGMNAHAQALPVPHELPGLDIASAGSEAREGDELLDLCVADLGRQPRSERRDGGCEGMMDRWISRRDVDSPIASENILEVGIEAT